MVNLRWMMHKKPGYDRAVFKWYERRRKHEGKPSNQNRIKSSRHEQWVLDEQNYTPKEHMVRLAIMRGYL